MLTLLSCLALSLQTDDAFKLSIELEVPGVGAVKTSLLFISRHAVELDAENAPSALFDLDNQTWREIDSKTLVKLEEAEQWARNSAEKTRASLDKVQDPEIRRFVESLLEPKFSIEEEGKTLTLKNEFLTYRIPDGEKLNETQSKAFFAYDKLNALRKAYNQRKLPPYPQLAVTKELESRSLLPKTIEFSMKTKAASQNLKISIARGDLSPEDKERASKIIQEHGR